MKIKIVAILSILLILTFFSPSHKTSEIRELNVRVLAEPIYVINGAAFVDISILSTKPLLKPTKMIIIPFDDTNKCGNEILIENISMTEKEVKIAKYLGIPIVVKEYSITTIIHNLPVCNHLKAILYFHNGKVEAWIYIMKYEKIRNIAS